MPDLDQQILRALKPAVDPLIFTARRVVQHVANANADAAIAGHLDETLTLCAALGGSKLPGANP